MITILEKPKKYQPAYGNLVMQFSSDKQSTRFKFRYVVDVYADNEYITRLKITPQNTSWGQCDLSEVLRNYVNSKPMNIGCGNFTPVNQASWGYLNEDIVNYRIFVGEEYATTANGSTLIYTGGASEVIGDPAISWSKTDEKYTFNGVKEWFDGKDYNTSQFYLNTNLPTTSAEPWDTHRYLTNAPRVQYVREGDWSTLSALNPHAYNDWNFYDPNFNVSDPVFSSLFEFYDDNNSLVLTARTYNLVDNCGWRPNCSGATNTFTPTTQYQKSYISYVGTGPANLLEHNFTVPSNVKWYRVALEKSEDSNPGVTPTPTPTPSATPALCDCNIYDVYNQSDEIIETYYWSPCPGDAPVGSVIAPQTIARVESCFLPYSESKNIIVSLVGPCDCDTPDPTPTPTPSASAPVGIDTYVIAQNMCDEEATIVHFILNTTTTPIITEHFCYNGEVYQILSFGGGGFVQSSVTLYETYSQAYAVCPCTSSSGSTTDCQNSFQISEWFYYYYDNTCSPNNQRIMFQNKLGTYDYYTFRGLDDVGYNVNRETYGEAPELYVDGWNSTNYRGWNSTNKVWNNAQNKTGILRTGYIPKSDAIWLAEELLRSPNVFIIDDNGDLEPIVLTNNEVVEPNPDRPGLMEIIVEYTGGYKELRQNN